jgi:CRP/FNR family cyclic AMP-dependent transcriptional regulator
MIESIPLFAGLPDEDLAQVENHGSIKTYRKNTIVINQDDESDSLYVILSGSVKVFISGDDGREVVLNQKGEGEYFGEMALIDRQPRSASVLTLQPSRFMIISRTDFMQCLSRNPRIALNLIEPMSRRIRALTENVTSLALLDVYGRVARVLLDQAVEEDGRTITGKLTQQDIADMVGASRAMVSRIIKDLKLGGYISIEKKRIIINQQLPSHW